MLKPKIFLPPMLLILAIVDGHAAAIDPEIELSTGRIQGRDYVTISGSPANVFEGIPFAKPPIGDLRFKKPVPIQPWKGTVECKNFQMSCPYLPHHPDKDAAVPTSEDCLYLNVYAPPACSEARKCPVMVYIYGGGNVYGDLRKYGRDIFVDNYTTDGVIVVTPNYRMGVLGLFSTKDGSTKGNNVIWDIIESLKWIRREIGRFGGDKNMVTIMGKSSSAQIVSGLTMSPAANGLFQQAISLSGSSYFPTFLKNFGDVSKDVSVTIGCATEDQWESGDTDGQIVECLRGKNVNELIQVQNEFEPQSSFFNTFRIDGPNGAFPDTVPNLAKIRQPRPYLLGTTLKEQWFQFVPITGTETVRPSCKALAMDLQVHPSELNQTVDQCAANYRARDYTMGNDSVVNGEIISDEIWFMTTIQDARNMDKEHHAPVYLYSFDLEKEGMPFFPSHTDDICYFLNNHCDFELTKGDQILRRVFPRLLTNFMKYSNPTPNDVDNYDISIVPKWNRFSADRNNYYSINLPECSNRLAYHAGSVDFWSEHSGPNVDLKTIYNEDEKRGIQQQELSIANDASAAQKATAEGGGGVNWMAAFIMTLMGTMILVSGVIAAGLIINNSRKHSLFNNKQHRAAQNLLGGQEGPEEQGHHQSYNTFTDTEVF